jgi:hypothetical protein
MGTKQSKVVNGKDGGNGAVAVADKPRQVQTAATTTTSVSYYSKKCINIHTYLGASPSSHHNTDRAHHPAAAVTQNQHSDNDKNTVSDSLTLLAEKSTTIVYELKKRRPGCTGMFWREDPTGETRLESNDNWPRDGAHLMGRVITTPKSGEKWLLVFAIKQQQQKGGRQSSSSSLDWKKAPAGAAMPFEYNNHYYLAELEK